MALDSKMHCLCCDTIVLIDSAKWGALEMPIALCPRCAQTVPKAVVRVLFILRSQVAMLSNDVTLIKGEITKIYQAQAELEQEHIGAT